MARSSHFLEFGEDQKTLFARTAGADLGLSGGPSVLPSGAEAPKRLAILVVTVAGCLGAQGEGPAHGPGAACTPSYGGLHQLGPGWLSY